MPIIGFVNFSTTDAHERSKDFLDCGEIRRLLDAAKRSLYGARDYAMLLMMYRHGLRASELINLRAEHVNLSRARLWVRRLKGSLSTEQPIEGDELRAIRRWLAQRDSNLPWLFVTQQRGQFTRQGVHKIVRRAGERAGLGIVWPHMLRHSCGFHLANIGADFRVAQDYLGHRNPQHTARYTRVAGKRFEGLW